MADAFLHAGGLVGRPPRVPVLRGLVKEGTCLQHLVCFNEKKGRVCDVIFLRSSLRFLLGGLKSIDILNYTIAINVLFLYFILQSQDVDTVKSTTYGLEVGEELFGI